MSTGRERPPVWLYALGGCAGLLLLVTTATCVTCTACVATGNEGGTRYSNTMEQYALDYLAQHPVLEPGEPIVAYYDATMSLDATEAAILTDRRLVYYRGAAVTSLPLADITAVHHREEPLLGTMIDVVGAHGELVHVEIAPLNAGPGFVAALERQRATVGGATP